MKHGGDLTEATARHGGGDPPWLDLSTGINPHPWLVPEALRRSGWETLPSRADLDRLLAAARDAYGVPDGAEIVAAPGTQALIQWLPRLAPSGDAAILGPTYGEHAAAWRSAGAEIHDIDDPSSLGRACHAVIVEPNNPDGRVLGRDVLAGIVARCAERGGWCILDRSFADVVAEIGRDDPPSDAPVVVLRSFGKFYGLAGLRLGFAVAPPRIGALLAEALGPWSVSGPALAVGAAALADRDWAVAMRQRLDTEARALDAVLVGHGFAAAGGTSLFRLVRHPEAGLIQQALAAEHVWVRRFDWAPDLLRFGLPPGEPSLERLRHALGRAVATAHAQGTTSGRPR